MFTRFFSSKKRIYIAAAITVSFASTFMFQNCSKLKSVASLKDLTQDSNYLAISDRQKLNSQRVSAQHQKLFSNRPSVFISPSRILTPSIINMVYEIDKAESQAVNNQVNLNAINFIQIGMDELPSERKAREEYVNPCEAGGCGG